MKHEKIHQMSSQVAEIRIAKLWRGGGAESLGGGVFGFYFNGDKVIRKSW